MNKPKHLRRGRRARAAPSTAEARAVAKLTFCAAVFVLLVAVKLLFPQQMAGLARSAGRLIGRDADFQAAFAAMGRAISGDAAVSDSLQEAYTAVFDPVEDIPAQSAQPTQTSAQVRAYLDPGASLLTHIRRPLSPERQEEVRPPAAEELPAERTESAAAPLSRVYTMAPPPENASLEQRNLGFDHVSPLVGALSSPFGWREHPIEGGTKFHYGVDLAADTGTDICAFADGEVYATGESSALGLYIMLTHPGGYRTLYAHCSAVTATGGSVRAGDKVAEVGETGMATGPHLHFELQDGDLYLNPIYYVELG